VVVLAVLLSVQGCRKETLYIETRSVGHPVVVAL
jgi:hypothetical protein